VELPTVYQAVGYTPLVDTLYNSHQ